MRLEEGKRKRARGTVGTGKRGSCFSIIAIFIGIPSGCLCGGGREGGQSRSLAIQKSESLTFDIFVLQGSLRFVPCR